MTDSNVIFKKKSFTPENCISNLFALHNNATAVYGSVDQSFINAQAAFCGDGLLARAGCRSN